MGQSEGLDDSPSEAGESNPVSFTKILGIVGGALTLPGVIGVLAFFASCLIEGPQHSPGGPSIGLLGTLSLLFMAVYWPAAAIGVALLSGSLILLAWKSACRLIANRSRRD